MHRHILRLTPVSNTCYASNLGEVEALARKVLEPIFRPLGALPIDEPVTVSRFNRKRLSSDRHAFQWKMQLSIRSHNTLSRMLLIPAIGGLVQHLVTEPAPASSRHSTTNAAVEPVSDTTTTITQQPETGMIQRRTLKANLERPEKVVLVEILRNTCGISVVDGELYEHLGKRFNLEQIAESFFQPDAAVTH